ncbi:MAG: sugar ABC transporter ATP-binding protein [Candidatus Nanopelagicales bacterium]
MAMAARSSDVATPVLRVVGLTKRFGRTQALKGVGFEVHAGEGVALLGRNGAGKSTLIKLLAGVNKPDAGGIEVDGAGVSPAAGDPTRIAFIHQELGLIDSMSVAENLAFHCGYRRRFGMVSWSATRRSAESLLRRWNVEVDADSLVGELSPVDRTLVAVVRALSTDARCIVLDEPTATLPAAEVDQLLAALADVKAQGIAIVYVTHRFAEVLRIAERYVVLRDGAVVHDGLVADTDQSDLIRMVVGEEAEEKVGDIERHPGGAPVIEALNLTAAGLDSVSFQVLRGQVLGLVGLEGSGHREAGRALAGDNRMVAGSVLADGRALTLTSVREANEEGIVFLPGDRLRESAVPAFTCAENLQLRPRAVGTWLSRRQEDAACAEVMAEWGVVASSTDAPLGSLSGGNQQKLLVAKWVRARPRVLIAEEPTAGVDVGARRVIHRRLREAAADGAVVVTSADTEEIAELCDRVLIFQRGRIVHEVLPADVTESRIAAHVLASNGNEK